MLCQSGCRDLHNTRMRLIDLVLIAAIMQVLSCPHYSAELLIYLAIALILQNFVGTLPLLCSTVNLSFTAANTHRWYQQKFKEVYPEERRWAIVPYVL